MSKIEVDTIEPQSGTSLTLGASGDTITIPSGATLTNSGTATGFGKVLQVVSTTKTDAFTTTSISLVDVTALSVSITPSSASNKILVMCNVNMGAANTNFGYASLLRGATQIYIGDTASDRPRVSAMSFIGALNEGTIQPLSILFLDSPNTTSSTTYKIQVRCASVGNISVNRSFRDTDDPGFDPRIPSTITVMEIAG